MNKVLVTGAAGFIGSKIVEKLLLQGVSVVGIDNLNDYYDPALKNDRAEGLKNPKFTFLKMDIESKDDLLRLFKTHQFDVVFNLAARAGVRLFDGEPRYLHEHECSRNVEPP